MAKANVIYRGPVLREPLTKTARVNGALLPGSVVSLAGGQFSPANKAKGRLFLLNVRDFTGQLPDQPYTDGDTAAAFRLEGEQEYQVQTDPATAGAYTEGQELTVNATGQFTKTVAAGDLVVAICERAKTTTATDLLIDAVILSTPYAHA